MVQQMKCSYPEVGQPRCMIWPHSLTTNTYQGTYPKRGISYECCTENTWSSSSLRVPAVEDRSFCCWSSRRCRCCTCSRRSDPWAGRNTPHPGWGAGWPRICCSSELSVTVGKTWLSSKNPPQKQIAIVKQNFKLLKSILIQIIHF